MFVEYTNFLTLKLGGQLVEWVERATVRVDLSVDEVGATITPDLGVICRHADFRPSPNGALPGAWDVLAERSV